MKPRGADITAWADTTTGAELFRPEKGKADMGPQNRAA